MKGQRTRDRFGHRAAGFLGPLIIRIGGSTSSLLVAGEERVAAARAAVDGAAASGAAGGPARSPAGSPVLFSFWHGCLLPLIATHRSRGIVALVSEHSDGEYIRRVLEPLGYGVVRGSTTRGGTRALFEMAARARAGCDLAVTPDGPRGPRRAVGAGVLAIARRAGIPIVPVGACAAPAVSLPTWDAFLIPLPGSRLSVCYGEALVIPLDGPDDSDSLRALLAERIEDATLEAERRLRDAARSGRVGGARARAAASGSALGHSSASRPSRGG